CEQAPPGSFLTPTGIVGEDAEFISAYSSLQVVGDFNGFNASVPSMSFDNGVWADTLTVQVGCYLMKFRTDGDWDETPDLGRCDGTESDCEIAVPTDGTAASQDVCAATGTGTALGQIEFLENGSYLFEFDERVEEYRIAKLANVGSISGTIVFTEPARARMDATVTILEAGSTNQVTQVISDPADGTFLAEALAPGTYDVQIQAAGYQEEVVTGVQVQALQNTDIGSVTLTVGCSYFYTAIQVVGDFNGFDDTVPSMTQIGNCVWADTLTIDAGCYYMKLRTNGDWDPTPDFGRCSGVETPCDITVPTDGTFLSDSTCAVTGTGTAIGQIEFLATGLYEFQLDEAASMFRIRSLSQVPTGSVSGSVAFSDSPAPSPTVTVDVYTAGTTTLVTTGMSDPGTDTYSISGLFSGSYDLVFSAPGYLDETVTAVMVNAPADTPVPLVTLSGGGSVSGSVTFSDSPATSPTVTVTVFDAGTTNTVATGMSVPATDTFSVGNLPDGTYDLRLRATNYADAFVNGVSVTAPNDTPVGTVAMTKQCTSTFTSMDVQFLGIGFPQTLTPMVQVQPCVWQVTITLNPGCSELRFPTSDPAKNYLACSGSAGICRDQVPTDGSAFSQAVCAKAFGTFIGEIQIQTAGDYEFTVDEGAAGTDQAVFSVRKL
ncbi:MAG: DUF3869 domain-containing protein, partial [Gemmatimonadetes bacterium]|nr:DUF3869 domain-containing protein [Gemmatimonadota bacterium]